MYSLSNDMSYTGRETFCNDTLEYYKIHKLYNGSNMPSNDEIYQIIGTDKSLTSFAIEQRIKLLAETKRLFDEFLNGKKIWGYEYRKSELK